MKQEQEPKYEIKDGKIFNRQSGDQIPEDEPLMIFRARDRHAAKAIAYYHSLLKNPSHQRAVMIRVNQFTDFAIKNPDRMKEPDTTIDAGWQDSWKATQPT